MQHLLKKAVVATGIAVLVSACGLTHATTNDGGPITSSELTQKGYSFPTDLVSNANQTQKSNYAWRLFIAAMQQTTATLQSGQGRAVAGSNYNFIQTGSSPARDNPLVFESFYHRTEAFPYYNGTSGSNCQNQPASPIDRLPVYQTYYKVEGNSAENCLVVSGANYVYTDETNEISQNFLYYQHSHDPDFPVLFMAKVNATETNYAFNHASPSASSSWDFPDGVIEVKTAWRRVKDIQHSSPQDYHLASGTYYVANGDNAPTEHNDTLALIAIHIIQKTANYPEFIFTTFEHKDAVTRDVSGAISDPAYRTEYNELVYETPSSNPHTATALGAYYVNEAGQPSSGQNILSTYTLPNSGTISQDYTTVVQPRTILKQVNDVNNQVNAQVNSLDNGNIWANYRLKGVQATPTSDSDSGNFFLANIVVESSQPGVQLFEGILLNGGVAQSPPGGDNPKYFVNCRGVKGNTECAYPVASLNQSCTSNSQCGGGMSCKSVSGLTGKFCTPDTYNNVSLGTKEGQPVPSPQFNMGGCQGCHGAAQQLGRDFSFLANGAQGKGKELDSVAPFGMSEAAKAAHNSRMSASSNFDLNQ